MKRVEIKGQDDVGLCTNCFIDGVELKNVRSVDFNIGAGMLPKFTFQTMGIPDIDVMGRVEIKTSPTNIKEACQIVTHELHKHGEFYDAYVASIASVLEPKQRYIGDGCFCIDIDADTDYKGLAEEIVKRISGEE